MDRTNLSIENNELTQTQEGGVDSSQEALGVVDEFTRPIEPQRVPDSAETTGSEVVETGEAQPAKVRRISPAAHKMLTGGTVNKGKVDTSNTGDWNQLFYGSQADI